MYRISSEVIVVRCYNKPASPIKCDVRGYPHHSSSTTALLTSQHLTEILSPLVSYLALLFLHPRPLNYGLAFAASRVPFDLFPSNHYALRTSNKFSDILKKVGLPSVECSHLSWSCVIYRWLIRIWLKMRAVLMWYCSEDRLSSNLEVDVVSYSLYTSRSEP